MRTACIAIALAILLALGAGRKYASVHDELVAQRRDMSDAWAEVDAVLQKHAGAVPGLIDGVKDAVRDRPQILSDIEGACTALGNGRSPEERIEANARLNAAISKLLLWSDSNPHPKFDQGFAHLEAELSDAESRIALPRRKYNEALEHYNAQIQQFPENVVASIAGFRRNDAYFRTELGDRAPGKPPI